MPPESTSAPAATPPARTSRARPANRAPTPPGPVAGYPIGAVKREPKPDLPPHIPPHMAGIISTPRSPRLPNASANTQRGAVSAVVTLHPAFVPSDQAGNARAKVKQLQEAAVAMATRLSADVPHLEACLTGLDTDTTAKQLAELEGLDLLHLAKFVAALKTAVLLTQPPAPAVPAPASDPG